MEEEEDITLDCVDATIEFKDLESANKGKEKQASRIWVRNPAVTSLAWQFLLTTCTQRSMMSILWMIRGHKNHTVTKVE